MLLRVAFSLWVKLIKSSNWLEVKVGRCFLSPAITRLLYSTVFFTLGAAAPENKKMIKKSQSSLNFKICYLWVFWLGPSADLWDRDLPCTRFWSSSRWEFYNSLPRSPPLALHWGTGIWHLLQFSLRVSEPPDYEMNHKNSGTETKDQFCFQSCPFLERASKRWRFKLRG